MASGQRSAALLARVAHQSHHTDRPHMSDVSHAGQGMSNVSPMLVVFILLGSMSNCWRGPVYS